MAGYLVKPMEAPEPWTSSAASMADSTLSNGVKPKRLIISSSSAPATNTRPAWFSRFRGNEAKTGRMG